MRESNVKEAWIGLHDQEVESPEHPGHSFGYKWIWQYSQTQLQEGMSYVFWDSEHMNADVAHHEKRDCV